MSAEFAESYLPPDPVATELVVEAVRRLELVKSPDEPVGVSRFNPDGSERLNYDSPGMLSTYAAIDNFRESYALKFGRRKA